MTRSELVSGISDRRSAPASLGSGIAQPIRWSRRAVALPHASSAQPSFSGWFDGLWVAVALGFFFFARLLGPLVVLLTLGMLATFVIARYRRVPAVLAANVPVLMFAVFAIASTTWSIAPSYAFYYGVQYLMTVLLGVFIGAATDRRWLMLGLFAACAVHAVASLLLGDYVDWSRAGSGVSDVAFAGLMVSKNAAADTAAIGLLVSGATFSMAIIERRPLLLFAAGLILCLDGWILLNAHSTGALIGLLIGAAVLVILIAIRPLAAPTRTALFVVALLLLGTAAATQDLWLRPLTSYVLEVSQKDAGLTGRSFIWQRASYLIEQRPLFGLGYNSFWIRGNLEAEGIWRHMGIAGRAGFNFHSTWREIAVHLGFVGLAYFAVTATIMTGVLLLRTVRNPSPMAIFFSAYLVYVAARIGVESQAFSPFTHSTLLIMAALASATRQRIEAPRAKKLGTVAEKDRSTRSPRK